MALTHYAAVYKDTFLDFCSDFARFLVDDLTSFTGPGWTIIEAYDDAVGSRQVPGDPADMDSFTGTFSWKDNTVGVNDWIVLRSNRGTTEFQVFFKVASTTTLQIRVVPLDDWATDVGTPTATPVEPSTAFGAGAGSPVTMTGFTSRQIYSIVADNGMCAMLFEDLRFAPNWTYFGETVGGPADDTRPFVIWDVTADVRWSDQLSTGGNWTRLSPLDNTTILTTGTTSTWYFEGGVDNVHRDSFLGLPGSLRPLPVGLSFQDTGHHSFAGILNHVFSASSDLGANGTFNGLTYMFRNDGTIEPAICFEWDGTTDYPPLPF